MPRKDFRIELGLNRKAAPLSRTNPNMRLFPLQNALIDVTDEDRPLPAWYTHLTTGDTLSYRLVDITDSEPAELTPNLVKLSFRDPDSGRLANPFDENVQSWRLSDTCELRRSPVFSRQRKPELPTWDVQWRDAEGWTGDRLTLARPGDRKFRGFEMAVALDIGHDGWVNQFVFDPEMIVSERDN